MTNGSPCSYLIADRKGLMSRQGIRVFVCVEGNDEMITSNGKEREDSNGKDQQSSLKLYYYVLSSVLKADSMGHIHPKGPATRCDEMGCFPAILRF